MTEKLKLPNNVVDSDWKDNIDLDYEPFGTNKQEMEYVSPTEVNEQSIERIKAIDLKPLFKNRGRRIANIIQSEQMAA